MPIVPARLAFNAEGTPFSHGYGDVYHSADGGLGQAQHVFLAGNDLPARWQRRECFVVVETGFGLGLNFLATWAAWRADALRCARLHFVSCELHPFSREDLAELHARWPQFAELGAALRAQWPELTPGMHRLHLDDEGVTLSLCFGAARDQLAQLNLQADAFYLDGFAPARNPEMWSARICYLLARLARAGATLATWSVAGEVRENLRRAGFVVDKAPGFGTKRAMLRGVRAVSARQPTTVAASTSATRHALVIGAGLAGCALAERLAARGWTVELIDAAPAPGTGASGNLAGVLRPLPNIDDNRISRLTRAGALYAWRHIERLRARGHAVRADACGVLQLARDAMQEEHMRAVVAHLALPATHLCHLDARAASALAGWELTHGGWWFGGSGWVQPPSLCAANLASQGERIRTHFSAQVEHLEEIDGCWHALAADGRTIAAAPVAILAAGVGVRAFAAAAMVPIESARGQVSLLPAAAGSAPRVVLCRDGYVSPEVDGWRCAGATFDVEDADPSLRWRDHRANLDKLEAMLPGYIAALNVDALGGRVGFRPASPDRLPFIGALPVASALAGAVSPAALARVVRQRGLYLFGGFGARGLVWSQLGAETLASTLAGEPLPLEQDLCNAIDPARFIFARHNRHAASSGVQSVHRGDGL